MLVIRSRGWRPSAVAVAVALVLTSAAAVLDVSPAVASASAKVAVFQSASGPGAMAFEPNRGQLDPEVRFIARSPGLTVWLGAREIVLARTASPIRAQGVGHLLGGPEVVRLAFDGSAAQPAVSAGSVLPGLTHSVVGGDPRRWRSNLPRYSEVRYSDVAPGVDLLIHGDSSGLTYDVLAEPGADLAHVGFIVSGATAGFTGDGRLLLDPSAASSQHVPVTLPGRAGTVRVELGGAEPEPRVTAAAFGGDFRRPRLLYSTMFGGTAQDSIIGLAVDRRGAAYVTGFTASADFPTRRALQPRIGGGDMDFFVAKFSPRGRLIWSTYLGGSGEDNPSAIAVDSAGRVHLAGGSSSRDWPTVRPLQRQHGGGDFDAVVATLAADGGRLTYSTYLGGSDNESAQAITLSRGGRRTVAGATWSSDFPLRRPVQARLAGLQDIFVTQLSPNGRRLKFSTFYGGELFDNAGGVAVDARGVTHVAGWTESPDVRMVHPIQARLRGFNDGLVFGLTPAGRINYATYLGGRDNEDMSGGVAIGPNGLVHVAGSTFSPDFPTRRALQPRIGGRRDAYLASLSSNGRRLVRSTYLGGSASEGGFGGDVDLAVDSRGRLYLAGNTHSTDFPTVRPVQDRLRGEENAFVAVVAPSGQRLRFASYLGGSAVDVATSVAAGPHNSVYVAGGTTSPDFPLRRPFQRDLKGEGDGFLSRIRLPNTG